jgi:hypothetical protein
MKIELAGTSKVFGGKRYTRWESHVLKSQA